MTLQTTASTQTTAVPIQLPIIDITKQLNRGAAKTSPIISSGNNLSSLPIRKRPHKISTKVNPITDLDDLKLIVNYYLNQPKRFKNSTSHIRDCAFFILSIDCARRPEDLLQLTVGDVLCSDGTFKSTVTISENKTGKLSTFPLTPSTQTILTTYLNCRSSIILTDYLFLSRNGVNQRPKLQSIWKSVKIMAKETGLDKKYNVGTYTWRKTAIRTLYDTTHDIAVCQTLCNHRDTKTTLRYIDITQDDINSAILNLDYGIADML